MVPRMHPKQVWRHPLPVWCSLMAEFVCSSTSWIAMGSSGWGCTLCRWRHMRPAIRTWMYIQTVMNIINNNKMRENNNSPLSHLYYQQSHRSYKNTLVRFRFVHRLLNGTKSTSDRMIGLKNMKRDVYRTSFLLL